MVASARISVFDCPSHAGSAGVTPSGDAVTEACTIDTPVGNPIASVSVYGTATPEFGLVTITR